MARMVGQARFQYIAEEMGVERPRRAPKPAIPEFAARPKAGYVTFTLAADPAELRPDERPAVARSSKPRARDSRLKSNAADRRQTDEKARKDRHDVTSPFVIAPEADPLI